MHDLVELFFNSWMASAEFVKFTMALQMASLMAAGLFDAGFSRQIYILFLQSNDLLIVWVDRDFII